MNIYDSFPLKLTVPYKFVCVKLYRESFKVLTKKNF